ncbi:hypothetical protein B9G69_016525 [Bdellovibrio sp. SKB1291214]|uniref:hypothetical protein n=1 Tax=Bdellovibrio sp. SKB1291214 TaxID=1732569 RepID=UPI000B517713|nr:hypothetical protein [Bdellovibrio sp. SKB1291214]UYL08649.1 hypothetical protein B9G69_016525 [Bdellovibrio sp. SKB1291214]
MTAKYFVMTLAAGLFTLSGCALSKGTIKDSPRLESANIKVPSMSKLKPRDMSLIIIDSRAPEFKHYSAEIKAEITRALTLALGRQNIELKGSSANVLTLTIQDYKTAEFQEGCVQLNGSLDIPKKGKANASSNSCMEFKSFGRKVGADIGAAYENALSEVFKGIDSGMEQMP